MLRFIKCRLPWMWLKSSWKPAKFALNDFFPPSSSILVKNKTKQNRSWSWYDALLLLFRAGFCAASPALLSVLLTLKPLYGVFFVFFFAWNNPTPKYWTLNLCDDSFKVRFEGKNGREVETRLYKLASVSLCCVSTNAQIFRPLCKLSLWHT